MTDLLELNLSVRSYNCLVRAGIRTIEELKTIPASQLAHIRNMGNKSVREILEKLEDWKQTHPQPVGETNEFIGFTISIDKEKIEKYIDQAIIDNINLDPYESYTIRRIISEQVKILLEQNKNTIIELAATKAAENIQKKALPKLLDKLGGLTNDSNDY